MAPSVGHLHKLVARNLKSIKAAWQKASQLVQSKYPLSLGQTQGQLQAIPVRAGARQPTHPLAVLRQSQNRWYSSRSFDPSGRNFSTSSRRFTPGTKYNKATFPSSRIGAAVNGVTGRAPFAYTLRPNLTVGTLGRTAGGYSMGGGRVGGARYFSHTPACPAQVMQNVSQAVRAFWLSGQKAQYDGMTPSGEKRFRAVSSLRESTTRKMQSLPMATPGSSINFYINPTITAITPLGAIAGYASGSTSLDATPSLNTEGLLDILSTDFSRSLADLAAILSDIKLLSSLGNLPITYVSPCTLCIHFPGCDAASVETLCEEIGVRRGIIVQDEAFEAFVGAEIAQLFPFTAKGNVVSAFEEEIPNEEEEDFAAAVKWFAKPSGNDVDWAGMLSGTAETVTLPSDQDDALSTRSQSGEEAEEGWTSPMSGYQSIDSPSDQGYAAAPVPTNFMPMPEPLTSNAYASYGQGQHQHRDLSTQRGAPLEYQDFEGIYRFIELCDGARRR